MAQSALLYQLVPRDYVVLAGLHFWPPDRTHHTIVWDLETRTTAVKHGIPELPFLPEEATETENKLQSNLVVQVTETIPKGYTVVQEVSVLYNALTEETTTQTSERNTEFDTNKPRRYSINPSSNANIGDHLFINYADSSNQPLVSPSFPERDPAGQVSDNVGTPPHAEESNSSNYTGNEIVVPNPTDPANGRDRPFVRVERVKLVLTNMSGRQVDPHEIIHLVDTGQGAYVIPPTQATVLGIAEVTDSVITTDKTFEATLVRKFQGNRVRAQEFDHTYDNPREITVVNSTQAAYSAGEQLLISFAGLQEPWNKSLEEDPFSQPLADAVNAIAGKEIWEIVQTLTPGGQNNDTINCPRTVGKGFNASQSARGPGEVLYVEGKEVDSSLLESFCPQAAQGAVQIVSSQTGSIERAGAGILVFLLPEIQDDDLILFTGGRRPTVFSATESYNLQMRIGDQPDQASAITQLDFVWGDVVNSKSATSLTFVNPVVEHVSVLVLRNVKRVPKEEVGPTYEQDLVESLIRIGNDVEPPYSYDNGLGSTDISGAPPSAAYDTSLGPGFGIALTTSDYSSFYDYVPGQPSISGGSGVENNRYHNRIIMQSTPFLAPQDTFDNEKVGSYVDDENGTSYVIMIHDLDNSGNYTAPTVTVSQGTRPSNPDRIPTTTGFAILLAAAGEAPTQADPTPPATDCGPVTLTGLAQESAIRTSYTDTSERSNAVKQLRKDHDRPFAVALGSTNSGSIGDYVFDGYAASLGLHLQPKPQVLWATPNQRNTIPISLAFLG